MRVCSKCKILKEESDFPKNKFYGTGVGYSCLKCQREYNRQHYLNNKQQYINRSSKRTKRLRKEYKELKKGLKCIRCSEVDWRCLDFHHTTDKEFNISTGYHYFGYIKVKNELDKCIVLCANCHRKEHTKI